MNVASYGSNISEQTMQFLDDQTVLFCGYTDPDKGPELWRSDGTEEGTVMVKEINPGSNGSIPGNTLFRVIDNVLYFAAETQQQGVGLWRSDGTTEGTFLVQDRVLGSGSFYPQEIVKMGDYLFLLGSSDNFSMGLFRLAATINTSAGASISKNKINVFPNPAENTVTIVNPSEETIPVSQVKLINSLGMTLSLLIQELEIFILTVALRSPAATK
jgi:ELWxxDGT repeat protein